jgi:hypothetical protein
VCGDTPAEEGGKRSWEIWKRELWRVGSLRKSKRSKSDYFQGYMAYGLGWRGRAMGKGSKALLFLS